MSSACSNCGKPGHFFRECREPITSLGILAFRRVPILPPPGLAPPSTGPAVTSRIEWLLVRRRVSIGFIEIMRGKYELRDTEGLQALIDQATVEERRQLQEMAFTDLWRDLWNGPASRRYQSEFDQSNAKFDIIRSRGILASLCKASTTAWTEPEWGFPKGRRSSSETELACALRETYEEAGVRRSDLRVLEGAPLLEEYRGSNGISYRHRYWLAEAPATLEVRMDETNVDQRREISAVKWCTQAEAIALIRPYNREKRGVLEAGAVRV
jgi:8-oxo-dGTP pyrophosphatase MutT (NUDIX family)